MLNHCTRFLSYEQGLIVNRFWFYLPDHLNNCRPFLLVLIHLLPTDMIPDVYRSLESLLLISLQCPIISLRSIDRYFYWHTLSLELLNFWWENNPSFSSYWLWKTSSESNIVIKRDPWFFIFTQPNAWPHSSTDYKRMIQDGCSLKTPSLLVIILSIIGHISKYNQIVHGLILSGSQAYLGWSHFFSRQELLVRSDFISNWLGVYY